MGLGIKEDYSDYQGRFNKYKAELKDLYTTKAPKGESKPKDAAAKVAISKLLKNYRGLGQYENLKKSEVSKEINDILNDEEIKKQFPVKRLFFKVNKFASDVMSSIRSARGKLKTPELVKPSPEKKIVTIKDLADKLGLGVQPLEGTKDNVKWVIRNSSQNEALTAELTKDGVQHPCRLLMKDGQVHLVKIRSNGSNGATVARLPLKEATQEKILDLVDENFGFKSDADQLLAKLNNSLEAIYVDKGKMCYIEKSEGDDGLVIVLYNQSESKKDYYRLFLDEANNQVLINKQNTPLEAISMKNFSRETLLQLAKKFMNAPPEVKDTVPENTVCYLQLASVAVDRSDVRKYVSRDFDLSKKVKDYPPEDIQKLLGELRVPNLEYSQNDSMAVLVKKIAMAKPNGMMVAQAYQVVNHVFNRYLDEAKDQNFTLFKTLQDRYQEQNSLDSNEGRILRLHLNDSPPQEAKARNLAQSTAKNLLKKAGLPNYQEIGPFFSAGWEGKNGHHINGEIRKIGEDRYEMVIANAGSGSSSYHRPVYLHDKAGNPYYDTDQSKPIYGITTQVFEMDSAKAEAILTEILLFNTKKQDASSSESEEFYKFFEGTKIVENYGIPTRPFQNVGNCGVRNAEELFFYIAQRQNNVEAANQFQGVLEDVVREDVDNNARRYDIIREKLAGKPSKPKIEPWARGPSEFVLRDINTNTDNKFPMGIAGNKNYPIGRWGAISAGYSKEQANLVYQDGKYYLAKHPKCAAKDTVEYVREGARLNVQAGEKIELKKGDQVLLNGDAFLEVA